MNVWLVTIGEPVPVQEGARDRLHRTGYFAHFLGDHGHEVTWWTSTFDHFRKRHLFMEDSMIKLRPNLRVRLLKGCGYRNNLSLARMRDHRQIAKKFASEAIAAPRPDLLVAALPTIELSLESVLFGKREGVPVVLDMRAMWPDIFMDSAPAPARPLARLVLGPLFSQAHAACAGATAITGITKAFVDWGLARGGRKRSAFDKAFHMGYTIVPPPPEAIAKAEIYWNNLGITKEGGDFVACFFGNVGRQFDLGTVIDAARLLRREGRKFRFVLCGVGDMLDHFKKMAADIRTVLFPGWVGAAEIYVLMRRASVGLDPLPDRYDFLASINNKAIEYMSAGLPVLSSPNRGILRDLLAEHRCGLSCQLGNARELAATLCTLNDDRDLLAELSQNAARLFEQTFQAENVYAAMMNYLGEVHRDYFARRAFANRGAT